MLCTVKEGGEQRCKRTSLLRRTAWEYLSDVGVRTQYLLRKDGVGERSLDKKIPCIKRPGGPQHRPQSFFVKCRYKRVGWLLKFQFVVRSRWLQVLRYLDKPDLMLLDRIGLGGIEIFRLPRSTSLCQADCWMHATVTIGVSMWDIHVRKALILEISRICLLRNISRFAIGKICMVRGSECYIVHSGRVYDHINQATGFRIARTVIPFAKRIK